MPAFLQYYVRAMKNYTKFDGRDSRKQYWMFFAVNFVIGLLICWIPVVPIIYSLGVLCPGIGAGIRRLHDAGKSGWYMLLGLIPGVGFIILIVFLAQPGETEANMYGEVPFDEIENGEVQ